MMSEVNNPFVGPMAFWKISHPPALTSTKKLLAAIIICQTTQIQFYSNQDNLICKLMNAIRLHLEIIFAYTMLFEDRQANDTIGT